jgi:two-component system sensor histidine kinase DesK
MSQLFGWSGHEASRSKPRAWRAFGQSIGLLYLEPVAQAIFGYSGLRLGLAVLSLATFVATYYAVCLLHTNWSTQEASRPLWLLLCIFTALAIGLPFGFGKEWVGLPVYLSIVYAVTLPLRWAMRGILAGTVLAAVQATLFRAPGGAVAILAISSFAIGMMMLAFRQSRILVLQLQQARTEVARLAANEERLRIARDLHDLLGHSLSLIVLKSELAGRIADPDPAKTTQEIKDIEAVARQALADVRAAVSGYRQATLTDELDSARAVLAAAGLDAIVRISATPLPDTVDGLFGWAVREGVTNVVRHARASRCEIVVSRDGGMATLRIDDDGMGAGTSLSGTSAAVGSRLSEYRTSGNNAVGNGTDQNRVGGNGLLGLRERVEAADGSLEAGPLTAGGYRLALRAPISGPLPGKVTGGRLVPPDGKVPAGGALPADGAIG